MSELAIVNQSINVHVTCILVIGDSSGDVLYTDLKNNLYSSVSHFTFTHRPRLVAK